MTDEEMLVLLTEWLAVRLGVPDLKARLDDAEASLGFRREEIEGLKASVEALGAKLDAVKAQVAEGDEATRGAVAADVAKVEAAVKLLDARLLEVEGRRRQLAEDLINTLRLSAGG